MKYLRLTGRAPRFAVLMKWTQPSSHMSLTRGTMGVVARATHTHH